jgi:hypothetical protein
MIFLLTVFLIVSHQKPSFEFHVSPEFSSHVHITGGKDHSIRGKLVRLKYSKNLIPGNYKVAEM